MDTKEVNLNVGDDKDKLQYTQDATSGDQSEDKPLPTTVNTKIYWCSLILGIAVLEPWNGFLACMYYFQKLYEPDYHPEFTLPMITFIPTMLFQLLMIAFGKNFPMRSKLVGGLSMLTFFFYILLLFCKSITDKNTSFLVAVIITLCVGVFNAVTQSTACGLTGAMGCNGKYIGSLMIGNGLSGIMSNLLQFFCLIVFGNDESQLFKVTMLFYMVIAFFMMGSVYTSYVMINDPFTIDVMKRIPPEKPLKEIFRLAWPVFKAQGKNVFIIYLLTFFMFPGVIIAKPLQCFSAQWSIPMVLFLFNVFDTIGRYLPNYSLFVSPKGMTLFSTLRIFLVISICLIGYGAFDNFFVQDWWIIINVSLFALTNGAGTALTMIYGTTDFDEKDKEDAGKMMVFLLTLGICLGSITAQFVFAKLF